jgi:hypothetical protein
MTSLTAKQLHEKHGNFRPANILWSISLYMICVHGRHVRVREAGVWQAADGFPGRYVFSAVRDSRMWCPHDIGRDSWVWGEQEALEMMSSPHEVGDEALTERSPCREEAGWPVDVSDCCCCCCCC